MNQANENIAQTLTSFLAGNHFYSALLLFLLLVIALFVGYLVLREITSRQSKQLAEASKHMSDALKASTESLVPVPTIVTGFSSLIEDKVAVEFQRKEAAFSQKVDDKLNEKMNSVATAKTEAEAHAKAIREYAGEIAQIKRQAGEALKSLEDKAKELSLLFPDVNKFKNTVDPEYLVHMLLQYEEWSEGVDIVVRLEDLVKSSESQPERLPSKFIELVGDWCRKRNQNHLALWFYQQAVDRDPEHVSAKVELNSLRAEVIPKERNEALGGLQELALSGRLEFDQIRRIFNVYIELDRFEELSKLTLKLMSVDKYNNDNETLASLHRNYAIALEHHEGYKTPEAWSAIEKAVKLSDDENELKIYGKWLFEAKRYDEAIPVLKKLLRLDPRDSSYYITLARVYLAKDDNRAAMKTIQDAKSFITDPNGSIAIQAFSRRMPSVAEGQAEDVAS